MSERSGAPELVQTPLFAGFWLLVAEVVEH